MINVIGHDLKGSVILWLDHVLTEEGRGFVNWSGLFQKAGQSQFSGIYSYCSPPRQWVYDSSVSGATIPTGIYVNSALSGRSSNIYLDFNRGQALFNSSFNSRVSGNLSYKEVNIYSTNNTEEFLLFDKKFEENPMTTPAFTGFSYHHKPTPCIFVKQSAPSNEIISFERTSYNRHPIRLIFVSDTEYLYQAVTNIIADKKHKHIPLFTAAQTPFNGFGDLKTGGFHYASFASSIPAADGNRVAFIEDVKISTFTDKVNNLINPRAVGGFIDLTLNVCRQI